MAMHVTHQSMLASFGPTHVVQHGHSSLPARAVGHSGGSVPASVPTMGSVPASVSTYVGHSRSVPAAVPTLVTGTTSNLHGTHVPTGPSPLGVATPGSPPLFTAPHHSVDAAYHGSPPSSGHFKPSWYVTGGTAKVSAHDSRSKGHQVRFILIGIITCICATLLPLFSATTLLSDQSYTFWRGYKFPLQIIAISICNLAVVVVSCVCLRRRHSGVAPYRSLWLLTSTSSALFGLLLILAVLPAQKDILATGRAILTGCSSPGSEVTQLNNFYEVLTNIRRSPACSEHNSVEFCNGWKANPYTLYLQHVEEHFQCGTVCTTAPSASLSAEAAPVALHARARHHGQLGGRLAATEELRGPEQGARKLFGRGNTRTTCLPLLSTHLEVLAWHCHAVVFWEGFLLLAGSIFIQIAMVCG